MFSAIYIETEIKNHPRVLEICERFSSLPIIECDRYGEVFNRNAQNFRIQKQSPSLILAKKYGKLVLPTPEGYGFEEQSGLKGKPAQSFYFSHMMNCIYDCRYCFLQGMYRSANIVLFVNFEDFYQELENHIQQSVSPSNYYSGYDCDSLAFEPFSHFCDFFLPLFSSYPEATLEIRTKSTQIRGLLDTQAIPNVVIAMSFASEIATSRWEHKVPSLQKRIDALVKLQEHGWPIALRFEPVIYSATVVDEYRQLFETVISPLNVDEIHSVSLGEFRMPTGFYKSISKLYPDESLYAQPVVENNGLISLKDNSGEQTLEQLEMLLKNYVGASRYYRCA